MGDIRLDKPFRFCRKESYILQDLRAEFARNWDYGAAALKRGALTEYFKELREIDREKWDFLYRVTVHFEDEMWNDKLHEDVVFTKYLYYLDPGGVRVPMIPRDCINILRDSRNFEKTYDESKAEQFSRSYGSRTGGKGYIDENYIAYMNREAMKAKLWDTYEDKGVNDAEQPTSKKSDFFHGLPSIARVYWWQEYLTEIGEFEG